MSQISFTDYLATHRPLVFDGAMGTEIYRNHVFTNRNYDELNLSSPELIKQIHNSYLEAGADVITTNTFGANRLELAQFGLAEHQKEILQAGAQIAREAADAAMEAGKDDDKVVFVAGSVGPVAVSEQTADGTLLETVQIFCDAKVDVILFETQPSRQSVELCVEAMESHPDFPYIISVAVDEDGNSPLGEPVEKMFEALPKTLHTRPVMWGLNCGVGPDLLLQAVQRVLAITDLPLLVQPNAGHPKQHAGRTLYLTSPEYLTEYARRFVSLGVAAVGGCCGTTPDHIAAISQAIKPLGAATPKTKLLLDAAEEVETQPETPLANRSQLGSLLTRGDWITTIELVSPRGYDLTSLLQKCVRLRQAGINAINIPDGPRASSRLSPLVTAIQILTQSGVEPILHFCTRDRNLIGMQADLLGCAAMNIRNILFVTGDPPKLGNYPHASGVFDTDSIGMTAVAKRLNHGIDLGGQSIGAPTETVLGVGLDPTSLDWDNEIDRFAQKVEAGAEFAITQPVFDPAALLRMLDACQAKGIPSIPIIAGIWPLASLRNAQFLQNEVPGVEIPDAVFKRMEAHDDKEAQRQTGIEIARESIAQVQERIAGVQVSAPFGNVETALAVVQK